MPWQLILLFVLLYSAFVFMLGFQACLRYFEGRDRKQAETQRVINHYLRGSE